MSGPSPDDLDGDVAGLAGLYALDALEGRDLARFEEYLATSPDAAIEVAEFRETAARLAALTVEQPPPSMRDDVLGSLAGVRQEPQRLDVERMRRRRTMTQRVAGVAAATLLVLGVGVGGYALGSGGGDAPDEIAQPADELAAVLANDDAAVLNMTGEDGVSARVVYSGSAGEVVLVASDLPPVPDGYTYELWQLRGDDAIKSGLFRPEADGTVRTALPVDLDGADGMAVTVEPEGGSAVPTMPLVMSATI